MKKTVLTAVFALGMISLFSGQHLEATQKNILEGSSIYQLDSKWKNQNDETKNLKSFLGQPVIIAMVYANCHSACPLIVEDMKKLEKTLTKETKESVHFVLASFDSEKDTPMSLKHFAEQEKLDLSKWTLLTSKPETVRELANVLNVQYKKEKDGNYSHSNIITVLDANGNIAYQHNGLGKSTEDIVKKIKEFQKTNKKI